jgi:hypothetical protein
MNVASMFIQHPTKHVTNNLNQAQLDVTSEATTQFLKRKHLWWGKV